MPHSTPAKNKMRTDLSTLEGQKKLKGIYLCDRYSFSHVYGPEVRHDIEQLVDIYAPLQTKSMIETNPAVLAEADIILSSWDMVKLDERILSFAPKLKAVFYGAGTIHYFMTPTAWKRGISVTSAIVFNSIPVAEITLAQILLSLKGVWHYALTTKSQQKFPPLKEMPGIYETTVGLVSLGEVGRRVARHLQSFEIHVVATDPNVSTADARQLNVEICSLDDLFQRSDVVSLHTPLRKETQGMITGNLIASMKQNATLINTARGGLICEEEMIAVLRQRTDLYAILDVTWPEPPVPNSPLYTLPNVVLTPHIAGATHTGEGLRIGRSMVEELRRYINGEPLKWAVTSEQRWG